MNGEPFKPTSDDDASLRIFTLEHRIIGQYLSIVDSGSWSHYALKACIQHLSASSVTQARRIGVVAAWADGDDAFCIIYRREIVNYEIGIRRTSDSADVPDVYEMPRSASFAGALDPVSFGKNVADFDIAVPFLERIVPVVQDGHGVRWWGDINRFAPQGRVDAWRDLLPTVLRQTF